MTTSWIAGAIRAFAAYSAGFTYSACADAAPGPALGTCIPFVDPSLRACDAPLCWCPCAAAPLLDAIAERAADASTAYVSLFDLASAGHVIIAPSGEELVMLRDSSGAVTLRCRGCPLTKSAARLTLTNSLSDPDAHAKAVSSLADLLLRPMNTTDCTRIRLLLRDGLIALDGKCLGASYRDIAIVIYGLERVQEEWVGASRWMKDRICRAHAKGEALRDGGYLDLLWPGCRIG